MADPKHRPPVEERWTDGMRTEPVRIKMRTEWLYAEYDPDVIVPEGRTRHAFYRGGLVTDSDVPSPYEHMQDIASHLHRAIAAFGDDKNLVIEVRLAEEEPVGAWGSHEGQPVHLPSYRLGKAVAGAEELEQFIAWADASPAVTWAGRLGLKERWEHRDDPEYQAMLERLKAGKS